MTMHTNHRWTDSDNDQLTLQLHDDGSALVMVTDHTTGSPAGAMVELHRAQALEVYHKLGDHLMATAETEGQVPTGYEVGADDLDAWAENRPELPDATTDGYDWPNVTPEDDKAPTNVLEEAQGAIYGDRQASYGNPRPNFTRQAIIWTGLLHHKLADGEHLEPDDVARCMVGTKLARDVHAPKRDNRVDMAGYAAVLDRLETGQ